MKHLAGAPQPPAAAYDTDIVILSLGRPKETVAAIGSALAQRGVTKHVTILDQGSAADDLLHLAEFVATKPDATLLGSDSNAGVAAGRNRVTSFGHGRVIIALDNDAVFATPETAWQAVGALDERADLAALGFRILARDGTRDDPLSWGYPKTLLPRAGEQFATATFVGAGHAIRRSAWDAVGGYDEALFFCWEEMDFAWRAIRQGYRIAYRGDIAVRHMVAPDRRVRWDGGRWFYFVRNRLYLARKHGARRTAVLALAAGYGLKGARNLVLWDGVRGTCAALRLIREIESLPVEHGESTPTPSRIDAVGRSPLWSRISAEVFARLPG
jgi:GT2 family glycosyltransferase